MNKDAVNIFWDYFVDLCKEFDQTRLFVDHREINGIDNNKTYSIKFLKIIMEASAEFEVVCKALCSEIDPGVEINGINDITRSILTRYPKIIETEISTPYKVFKPLAKWKIGDYHGLDWWTVHNKVKHNRFAVYESATLINALYALASLFVVELYLLRQIGKKPKVCEPVYFYHESFGGSLSYYEGESLPDYKD